MSTSELKYALFKAIDAIEDDAFLKSVYELIRKKTGSDYWDSLTKEQKEEIEEAVKELDNGEGIPYEQFIAKYKGKYIDKDACHNYYFT